ncbi:hypothetical protein N2152v2_001485 [Parachlorella kessleri]
MEDIRALLDEVHAILLASQGKQEQSDALFDAWPAIQRAAVSFPAAAASVAGLAGTAAVTCNPRELLSLFLESLLPEGHQSEASLAVQLNLLSLLPRLLLRIKRKWLAFLSDYLQMLLRWCTHMLPLLPWGRQLVNNEGAGAGAPVGGPAPAAPPSLPEAVQAVAEGLASVAAFVQMQQEQQGEQRQQPSQRVAPGVTSPVLAVQDAATAGSYLVWTVLQLASFLVQLPQPCAAAHAKMTLAGPAAMGKRLGALGPAAASLLELPARWLAVVLGLLPGQRPVYGALQLAVRRFQELESQRQAARAAVTVQTDEEGLGEGGCKAPEEEEEEEEGLEAMLHPARLREGAALTLCSAVLSRHSTALTLTYSSSTATGALAVPPASVPPGFADSTQSGAQVPQVSLQLLQIPSDSRQVLSELASAVQLLLDVGARSRSVPLVVLSLHCLAVACNALASGEVLTQRPSPVASASTRLGLGPGLAAGSRSGSMGVGSSGSMHGGFLSQIPPEVQQLIVVLVQVMSFNPVEVVRSCAHEALNALLSAFAPAARLQAILSILKMESSAAVVVGLQRLRQEVAFAWLAASGPQEGTSPFLDPEVLNIATNTFRHSRQQQQAGWADDQDVLSNADAMAAALSLYRFVLLRQQSEAGAGHGIPGGHGASAGQEGIGHNSAGRACADRQGTILEPASTTRSLTLVTKESVQSTLQNDLVPLHAAVLDLLGQHEEQHGRSSTHAERSMQLQQRPAGELSSAGGCTSQTIPSSSQGDTADAAAVVKAGTDWEELEGWLAVQRLLDVLERVIEISKSWQ